MSITAYIKGGKKAYRAKFKHMNRQITKAGFNTKAAAREWQVEEKKRLIRLTVLPQTPLTIKLMYSAACANYLADSQARHQPGTFAEKSRHLTEFIEFIGHDIPVELITANQAESFISKIQKNFLSTGKSTAGPSEMVRQDNNKTANRYLRTLKAFWNWTSRREYIGSNPFIHIAPYSEDTTPRYVPPVRDVIAVLAVAKRWERTFLSVLVKTAARPGEVRTLRWEDVDFARGTITLWTRKRRGGERQPRLLNMSSQLADELRRHYERREDETWVFVNPLTQRLFERQSRSYKYLMERLCRRAAENEGRPIREFTFYSLRHFVATQLRSSGKASKYEIQHILGHKRSDTTDIYLRSLAPDLAEAVSSLDTAVNLDLLTEKNEPV